MKIQRIDELLVEFRLKVQEYYICLHFAANGLKEAAEMFEQDKPKPTAKLWLSDITMGEDGAATINKHYASIAVSEYLSSSRENGSFSNEIAKAFVCAIYSLWDEKYRVLIARDARVDQRKVSADLMGDLRHIRNCIVHSKSILKDEHSKVKVLNWSLQPGELIITKKMFADFIDQINTMPVAVEQMGSPLVQRFYDELSLKQKKQFDKWIAEQGPGADIRTWPQWESVTRGMPWVKGA